jgi:hypothetical protein
VNFSKVVPGMDVDIQPAFQKITDNGVRITRIAYISVIWRILVGNGKWGKLPGAKLVTTKGRGAEMRKSNRLEEVEMFTNRLFKVTIVVVLVVVGLLALQPFAKASETPKANPAASQSDQQALHEYRLTERYGEVPASLAQISAEQAAHENRLREWYGDVPQNLAQITAEQAAHNYNLSERYGEVPQALVKSPAEQAAHEYRMTEWYGDIP